ncbi:MAG: hypothetical protein ABIF85_00720 [Nanoarchaeota archaeon]|nr:heparinase II/III-family protein [Nanoarchaeota archaeon]
MNSTNISVPHPSLLFTNISETPGYQHRTEEPWLGWEKSVINSAIASLARNFSAEGWIYYDRMLYRAAFARDLALAYQITKNESYAEKAKEALLNIGVGLISNDIDKSDALEDYSFAYDWTQPYLDPANDTIIRDKLANLTDVVYMDLNDNGTYLNYVTFADYHGKAYPSVGIASLALYDYTNPNSITLVSGPSDWLKVGTDYLFVDDKLHIFNRSVMSFGFSDSGKHLNGAYKGYVAENFMWWLQAYSHFLNRNALDDYPVAKNAFTSEIWESMPNHYHNNYITDGNRKIIYSKGIINLLDSDYKSYVLNHLEMLDNLSILPYSGTLGYYANGFYYLTYQNYSEIQRKYPSWTSRMDSDVSKAQYQVFRGSWLNDSDWLSFITWNITSNSNRDMAHHDQLSFEYYSRGDLLLADGGEEKHILDRYYGDYETYHNVIAIENPRSPFASSSWADSTARGINKGDSSGLKTPISIEHFAQTPWIEFIDADVTITAVKDTSTYTLSSPIGYSRAIIYPKDYFIVIDRMESSETWTYRNIFRPTSLNITPTKQYTNLTDIDINVTAGDVDAVHMITPTSFDGKSAELLVTLANVSAPGNLSVYINATYLGTIPFSANTSYYLRDIPSGNFTKGAANKINYSTTNDVSLVIDETQITIMGEVNLNLSVGDTYYDWLSLPYKDETQTGISTNSVKWNTTNPYGNKVEAHLFSSPASEIRVTKHVGRIAGYNTDSEVFNPVVYFRTGPTTTLYCVSVLLSRYGNETEKTPANLSVTGNGNAVKVTSTDYEDYIYSGSGSSTYATAATDADTAFNRYNLTSGKMQYIMLLNAKYFTYGSDEWLNSTQKISSFLMNISGTNRTITADGTNGTNATIYVANSSNITVKRDGVTLSQNIDWWAIDPTHVKIKMTFSSPTTYDIFGGIESDTTPPTITFVSPTWENNDNRPENWEFVNITLNEAGNVSLLEWNNGTSYNYTMQGSGTTNFYLNMTNQTGMIMYRVYANDSAGNMNISEIRTVTLNYSVAPITIIGNEMWVSSDGYSDFIDDNVSKVATCFQAPVTKNISEIWVINGEYGSSINITTRLATADENFDPVEYFENNVTWTTKNGGLMRSWRNLSGFGSVTMNQSDNYCIVSWSNDPNVSSSNYIRPFVVSNTGAKAANMTPYNYLDNEHTGKYTTSARYYGGVSWVKSTGSGGVNSPESIFFLLFDDGTGWGQQFSKKTSSLDISPLQESGQYFIFNKSYTITRIFGVFYGSPDADLDYRVIYSNNTAIDSGVFASNTSLSPTAFRAINKSVNFTIPANTGFKVLFSCNKCTDTKSWEIGQLDIANLCNLNGASCNAENDAVFAPLRNRTYNGLVSYRVHNVSNVVTNYYSQDASIWFEAVAIMTNNTLVSLNIPQNNLATNNATVTFNCFASAGNPLVNLTLYGNFSGTWQSNGTANISGTSNSSQWFNTLADGSYIWNCLAYDNTCNSSFADSNYTLTIDATPPSTITNLANQSSGDTWIYWNWTNPAADFSHVEVWLNGTWKQNISLNYYNAIGLSGNTGYQIQTRTVDNIGNINTTWVNSTAKTTSDITAPIITVVFPVNGSALAAGTISTTVNITTNENATCRYSTNSSFVYADGTNFTNTGETNHSFIYPVSAGTYSLYYLCNDIIGNVNAEALQHTFSIASAVVPPTTHSGGGSGGGGTLTVVENKTNSTVANATVVVPVIVNNTNTTVAHPAQQELEIKIKAYEKINEVRQKIPAGNTKAKEKVADAEIAYKTGDYSSAYNLAVEAEGLIDSVAPEENKTNYAVYAVTLAVFATGAYAAKAGLMKLNKKIVEGRAIVEEDIIPQELTWKPAAPKEPKVQIPKNFENEQPEQIKDEPELSMPKNAEEKPPTSQMLQNAPEKNSDKTVHSQDDELDDIQRRLEEIKKKLNE